jgi:predicted ribosomally synthesized peptide with nif11-like leader
MNNPAPIPFLDAVAADPLLQGQCKAATSLGQLVAVAEAAGFTVSVRDLQLWAHHEAFHAPWWPWAGGGKAQCMAFFRGQAR